jgi:hypothetical protein
MKENNEVSDNSTICQSCGSKLKGKYCSSCGEKRFNPQQDLKIITFIEHSIDIFIHFDSKFFKTFKKLFFNPGRLTNDFNTGRRVLNMKPMQLFVFSSVIFYFLLPHTNAYYHTTYELDGKFGIENLIQYNANHKVYEKSIQYNVSQEQFANAINEKTIHSSKLFLFAIFPIWAFILFALFYKSNSFYVTHLVFSLHCFTFFILVHLIYLYILSKFYDAIPLPYIVPLFIIFAFYLFIAIRKVYHPGIFVSIIKCFIACFSFLLLLELYREYVTVINLALL